MEYASQFPEQWKHWHRTSNSVICLTTQSERTLWNFSRNLQEKGILVSEFREPDLGNELTSIAAILEPSQRKLCSGLPLAGKRASEGSQELLRRKFDLVDAMVECEQTEGTNMVEHGESVRNYMLDLLQFLRDPSSTSKFHWRFPGWVLSYGSKLLKEIPDEFTIEKYLFFHDCGKPSVKTIDAETDKVHFPGHAQESARIFKELFPGEPEIAKLIEQDMELHFLKTQEELEEFSKNPNAPILLLSALASIHSNAEMFARNDSDNFKIKWKQLERKGKIICHKLLDSF